MRSILTAVLVLGAASAAPAQTFEQMVPERPGRDCELNVATEAWRVGGTLYVAIDPRPPRISDSAAVLSCLVSEVELCEPLPKDKWARLGAYSPTCYEPRTEVPVAQVWSTTGGARVYGQGVFAQFDVAKLPPNRNLWIAVDHNSDLQYVRKLTPKDRQRVKR